MTHYTASKRRRQIVSVIEVAGDFPLASRMLGLTESGLLRELVEIDRIIEGESHGTEGN